MVTTQGAHLITRPNTPVIPRPFDHQRLGILLEALLVGQGVRCQKYGTEDAEKWPMGHTPIELREEYWALSKARWREMELQSVRSSDLMDDSSPEHPGPEGRCFATPSSSRSERHTPTWEPAKATSDEPTAARPRDQPLKRKRHEAEALTPEGAKRSRMLLP